MSVNKTGWLVIWLLFATNAVLAAAPAEATATPVVSPPGSATAASPPAAATDNSGTPGNNATTFTPEALEELLAPVALYPDGVLAQVLATSTRPQEVLDAGNWLVAHPGIKGKELEAATQDLGFTPAMVALMQFPDVVDMMCLKMAWTTELGSAFLADEPGVLAAVQRLRKQAADMGNLKNSEALKVDAVTVNNQDVITITSPDPKVVYVPQYNPVNTYTTPAPATAPAAAPAAPAAPAASTATTSTPAEEGHSTAALVTTGVLAFGAGILVNEVFSDDEDEEYYPYWGGGGGYYPPPYYPNYGNGFHPSHNYNNFRKNNVIINTGNQGDYWNRFDGNRNDRLRSPKSPISQARPERADLKAREQASWKGQSSYAGAQPAAREKMRQQRSGTAANRTQLPSGNYAGTRPATRQSAGNRQLPAGKQAGAAVHPVTRPIAGNRSAIADRGRAAARNMPATTPRAANNAFEGINRGAQAERAASLRGRDSAQRQRSAGKRQAGGRR